MRIIGPRKRFILIERVEGEVGPDGQIIYWVEKDEFGGVINSLRGREGISYDQTGVIANYRLWTEFSKITEEHRIKLKGTTREFDIKYVDNSLLKEKIWVIDLNEKK